MPQAFFVYQDLQRFPVVTLVTTKNPRITFFKRTNQIKTTTTEKKLTTFVLFPYSNNIRVFSQFHTAKTGVLKTISIQ